MKKTTTTHPATEARKQKNRDANRAQHIANLEHPGVVVPGGRTGRPSKLRRSAERAERRSRGARAAAQIAALRDLGTAMDSLEPAMVYATEAVDGLSQALTEKSADEWCVEFGITVHDPDGWDRTNYYASWAEPLTALEFARRASESTISGNTEGIRLTLATGRR